VSSFLTAHQHIIGHFSAITWYVRMGVMRLDFRSKRVLDLLEPGNLRLGQIVIERCSSQDWSEQWRWRWWKLFWYRGMDGYSEADEYGNSKIWRQMRSRQKKIL